MIYLAADDPMEHVLDAPVTWFGPGAQAFLESVGLTKQPFMLLVAGGVVIALFVWYSRRVRVAKGAPRGFVGGFVEAVLVFLRDDVARPAIGHHANRYLPFLWTLFFFILACNLLGLIPGLATATGNINVNAGLAIVAFLVWHVQGIREQGVAGYIKGLVPPIPVFVLPVMVVVEVLGHVVRPFALTVRLFANMLAGHVAIGAILGFTKALTAGTIVPGAFVSVVSVAGAVALTFLELFVAFLQAYIFTFLTAIFIGLAVHPEH